MKTVMALILVFLAASLVVNSCTGKDKKMIRVLLTTGGHDFEHAVFFEMFDNLPGISYDHLVLPDSADLLKPGLETRYDVIVRYDMVDSIEPDQEQAFTALLDRGIGLVALHHNLGAHRNWDEYARIIGGAYLFEPKILEGREYGPSDYRHDQDILVKVADPAHPVMQGISDFRIHDEVYRMYYVAPRAHVLLTTDAPESDPQLAWVTTYGKSPVVYLLLGHDARAWQNPVYRRLLTNAIRWVAD